MNPEKSSSSKCLSTPTTHVGTGYKCIDELRNQESIHSGLYLDNKLIKSSIINSPSQVISKAIYEDTLALSNKESNNKLEALTIFSKVLIQTKKHFGRVPDDLLYGLASSQPDLSVKSEAFGMLDKPMNALDLVDEVYSKISSKDKSGFNLHTSANTIKALSKHLAQNPELLDRKRAFDQMLIKDSFAANNPYYLTDLTLNTSSGYIDSATRLIAMTADSVQAVRLLSDRNGWLAIEDDKRNDALDVLTGVIVQNGTEEDLLNIANNVPSKTVQDMMISKISAQAFSTGYDARLAKYLSATNISPTTDDIKQLHIKLINNFTTTNTLASQKSLIELVKRASKSNEIYPISKLKKTIADGSSYLDTIFDHNTDKTLVEITNAKIVFEGNKIGLDTKIIDLSNLSNEHTLKNAIVFALLDAEDPDADYDLKVIFKEGTSSLLEELVTKQVIDSINNEDNDLDRLLNQSAPAVVKKLDSRHYVQEKILFDAAMLNADNSTKKTRHFKFETKPDGRLLNVNALSNPVLTIKDNEVQSYIFEDYNNFDELANDIYANHPNMDYDSIDYKLDIRNVNNYIDDNLISDVKNFFKEPSYQSLNKLNQYFTHSVQEFVDSREKNPSDGLVIKQSIKKGVDYELDSTITDMKKNKAAP